MMCLTHKGIKIKNLDILKKCVNIMLSLLCTLKALLQVVLVPISFKEKQSICCIQKVFPFNG